jgi:LmbE family N-acetylglucosaminyl deacetylase
MIDDDIYGSRSLLVIGAHAFDAEVMAGPLAAQAAKRGVEVTMLHLTMGEQGHTSLAPAAYASQKREEATRFCDRLGISWRELGYADAFLPDNDEVALKIADVIRAVKPETIVTHWHGSWHKDHRAAASASKNAVLYAALPTLERTDPAFSPSLLLFGENWEDDEGFAPSRLVDVSDGYEIWRAAIVEYELARGLSSFPYVDYYSALYRMRGCLNGTMHAQAFSTTSHSFNAGGGMFNGKRRIAGCGCGGHG